ncbi:hypothetical protein BGZ58_009410 [Dissophora ornata]|nr:hypothetical protein BGZ58_009410 [Dissophora ornata]
MKINPEIWRSEGHQREIHRLMHQGRQEEIMRRRDMKSVMDTSEEGDDEEDEREMSDVIMTMDLGGFRALEEREKERIQAEVRREWMYTLGHSQDPFRRSIWPNQMQQQMQQQQIQQAQIQAMRSASYQGGPTAVGGGTGGGAGGGGGGISVQIPNQVPYTGLQQRPLYGNTSPGEWASTASGFVQSPDYPRRESFTAYRG